LVAIASHVPHLLAGSLMNEASQVAEQDAVLLQLAAGGFRDMTRIAAGDPGIWPTSSLRIATPSSKASRPSKDDSRAFERRCSMTNATSSWRAC